MQLEKQDIYKKHEAKNGERIPLDCIYTNNVGWIKPIKDVYILTESEMIKLIDAAMRSNSLTAQYFLEEEI